MKSLMNSKFNGTLKVPGDKSITHRALMFGALAAGTTRIHYPLPSEDTHRTLECMRALGAEVEQKQGEWVVTSPGAAQLHAPAKTLYTGNSGTTTRLLTGLIAGLGLTAEMEGDESIAKRPMDRIQRPLAEMGADISLKDEKYPPIIIRPARLSPISYTMPMASAQVKSAILLAALYTEGTTVIHEPSPSRNHTEIMLEQFGADISAEDGVIRLKGGNALSASDVTVPGDISSAAFPIVLAVLKPGSSITVENVSLNSTRSGILDVLEMMGADVRVEQTSSEGEAIGTVHASHTPNLKGFDISGDIIPRLIDEIPIIALLAAYSTEACTVRDADELRYKETDRIRAVIDELSKFGISFTEYEDGFTVHPGQVSIEENTPVKGYNDHRIIMMLIISSIISDTPIEIDDVSAIDISYPGFMEDLEKLRKEA
ncbi:3-phosphoshikimate 1-carboxyvinyltransferase [Salinicoccus sp. RF5]|uniref:3-phosphoshikimate 1-carboxyvinyltransferase n=1 Tax=Salinicoccus sp. RF5 TaxID=2748874 RepID=UPI001E45AFDC|nr:3-phosphoshikimate 1-carboxyvinyltransferase [Salinicoccus sp. RF5]MCC4721697.1 3-phosphoshikimate 1-carboxyvinyltransferase [Salinicoccus sp. RF5]